MKFQVGVIAVGHLLNCTGEFLSYDQYCEMYPQVATNFLVYAGIINALKEYMHRVGLESAGNSKVNKSKVWNYCVLTQPDSLHICTSKWEQQFIDFPSWKLIFGKAIKSTPNPQLRWFQYRLLYRLLPTKRFLFARKLVKSALCTFCGVEDETLHLFGDLSMYSSFEVQ